MSLRTDARPTPPASLNLGRALRLAVVELAAIVAVFGAARQVTAPVAETRNVSCAWHGKNLVMTGIVINRSFSAHEFVLTPAFSLDGRAITESGSWAIHAAPLSAKAWRAVDVSLAGQSGSAITACNPSVALPSADD